MESLESCLATHDPARAAISATPLVTVVIPTYNYAHFLIETLESALVQTYSNFEVIVVDDGSTDDTRQRLEPYLDRIRYIYQENQGLSAARNTGIRAARGELIALLDSDDLWHPEKTEIQVRFLQEHPEVHMVASKKWDDPWEGWPKLDAGGLIAHPVSLEDLVVWSRIRFGACSTLLRKCCFDEVGFFDTSFRSLEDRDMWIRIASRFSVAELQLPLWWYRIHANSMQTDAQRMEEYEYKVLRKCLAEVPALKGRWALRRKAYSWAAYNAADLYTLRGQQWKTLGRMLLSFFHWPVPYRRDEVHTRLARLKMFILAGLRMLGLREVPQQTDTAALRRYYSVERKLADRLRRASASERRRLYRQVYDDLFLLLPYHEQNYWKADARLQKARTSNQMRLLKRFLHPGCVYLEVGAGDCHLAETVAGMVRQAYAVDVSDVIAGGNHRPANFTKVISDGVGIRVPASTVDLAYSHMMLEHLHPDDAEQHLDEVYRLLVPGGIYLCITQHRFSGPHDVSQYFDEVATGLHLQEFTYMQLRSLFHKAGFPSLDIWMQVKGRGFRLPCWMVLALEKVLGAFPVRMRRRLASCLPFRLLFVDPVVVGRKQQMPNQGKKHPASLKT
jgi:glycosyltransferase involved in cell wall biosynthesis